MKLLYALLCDNAFLSIDRKVNMIGVFETINAQKFPVTHPKFVIVGSIEPTKKNFKMSLNIVDEDSKPILGDIQEREVNLPQETSGQNFNFIIEVINTNFSSAGTYRVQVSIDGKVIGEILFKVLENKMASLGAPS
jgi:hypothetical protein